MLEMCVCVCVRQDTHSHLLTSYLSAAYFLLQQWLSVRLLGKLVKEEKNKSSLRSPRERGWSMNKIWCVGGNCSAEGKGKRRPRGEHGVLFYLNFSVSVCFLWVLVIIFFKRTVQEVRSDCMHQYSGLGETWGWGVEWPMACGCS